MTPFQLFLIGQLFSATILSVWFLTRIKIHLVHFVFRIETADWTLDDFDVWAALNLPPWFSELIGCPYCIGTHFNLWISFFFVFFTGAPWWFIVVGTLGWTALSGLILQKLSKNN